MAPDAQNVAAAVVDAGAERYGDAPALIEGPRELSYVQLQAMVRRAATALRDVGVAKGDRVAIFSPDTVDSAVAILGAMYAGAVAVPVGELSSENDARDVLLDCGASVIVVHGSLRETLDKVRSEVPSIQNVLVIGSPGPGEHNFIVNVSSAKPGRPAPPSADGYAFLLYSAGSSPESVEIVQRGAPHRHFTPLRSFESFGRRFLGLVPDDRVFSVVRFSTAYGLGVGLLFPLLAGATAIISPDQPTSDAVFSVIGDKKPTVFVATPSIYGQLARDAVALGKQDALSHLRICVSGAEDMPPKVVSMAKEVLGASVTVGYGLTEAFQFVMADLATARPGACGHALDGFELRILGDDGQPVGPNSIGTLQLRGETLIERYWGDDQPLSADGWFTTRDRFMVDDQGQFVHCGRVDHLFKVGGKWVSPDEVERALLGHEAVWECAVIGADDEDGLVKPLAFVVANVGHEPGSGLSQELREYVKSELAPYKYPRWIEFVDELPKGPQGGVLRYKLREHLRHTGTRRRAETSKPH